jgi:hypothetical protein
LKILLRTERLTLFSLYTDVILAKNNVPTMEEMITQSNDESYKRM